MNSNEYTKFIDTRTTPYSRWPRNEMSFYRPSTRVSEPLDQCQFVMMQLGKAGDIVTIDMWGNPIDPFHPINTLDFKTTRALWADDHGQTFDGYAIVLDEEPSPLLVNGQEYWLVAGLHLDCVKVSGRNIKFSNDFESAKQSLGEPLHGVCPNQKDAYWFGLSHKPINGGRTESAIISSYNQIIPIAIESGDEVMPLPIGAEKIIHNILGV